MNLFEKYKTSSNPWNCFSAVDTLGSFDFYTATISLDALKKKDFEVLSEAVIKAKKSGASADKMSFETYQLTKKIMPLAVHEFTHFVDATSTVWGHNYLKKLNDGFLADDRRYGGTEQDFVKAKVLYDTVKSLKLPKYYTVVNAEFEPIRPWAAQPTVGYQFSNTGVLTDRPIIFMNFSNAKNERIARSPISMLSILEVSAMAQEIASQMNLISMLSENEKIVESAVYTGEILNLIYNQGLTEYSVCAHLVANKLGCKDVFVTYQICSMLARVVLNFSDEDFKNISITPEVAAAMGRGKADERFLEILEKGIEYRSPGALYYLLTQLLPKDSAENKANGEKGIKHALACLSVKYEDVVHHAALEVEVIAKELATSRIGAIALLSGAGIDNFKKIDFLSGSIKFHELNVPPVILGDAEVYSIYNKLDNLLRSYKLEDSYLELVQGQIWVERFAEACL